MNATQLRLTGEEQTARWPTTYLEGLSSWKNGEESQGNGQLAMLFLLCWSASAALVKEDGRLDQQCNRPVIVIVRRAVNRRCCAHEDTVAVVVVAKAVAGCWVVPGGRHSGRG